MKKYLSEDQRGVVNGVAPLNGNKKIESQYLPTYTELNVTPSDSLADLSAKQTWTQEQTFNFDDYNQILTDNISGVACGFKAPRGLFNQFFINDIVFTRADNTTTSGMASDIGFYVWNGVDSKIATRDDNGNIVTAGYNTLKEYKRVAAITNDGGLVLKSSTPGSSKYFKLTIDDNGSLNTSEFNFSNKKYTSEEDLSSVLTESKSYTDTGLEDKVDKDNCLSALE